MILLSDLFELSPNLGDERDQAADGIGRRNRRVASQTRPRSPMIFKLAQAAEKSWRRLKGYALLSKVVHGVKFNDGIEVVSHRKLKPNGGKGALDRICSP